MHVGVVGLFDDREPPSATKAFRSTPACADSPADAQAAGRLPEATGNRGTGRAGPETAAAPSGRKFVGSEKCGECHTKALEIWAKTPHAHATESLIHPPNSRGDIPRHFDPECLSCHVTGWEPQKLYPFDSGYLSLAETPHLQHNGCENCHGPGSAHAAAESGDGSSTAEMLAKLREQMKLPLAGGRRRRQVPRVPRRRQQPRLQPQRLRRLLERSRAQREGLTHFKFQVRSRSQAPLGNADLEAPLPDREAELRDVRVQAGPGGMAGHVDE